MSAAGEHALAELRSLADGDWMRIEGDPRGGRGATVEVDVSIGTPPPLHPSDAWDVRAREDFTLIVPPDYPFAAPHVVARHLRWAGAPHVQWGRAICLYATTDDWNPQDGLRGFLERLERWLGQAAEDAFDDVPDAPEHPPITYTSDPLIVTVRENAPPLGESPWIGWAVMQMTEPRSAAITGWSESDLFLPGIRAAAVLLLRPAPFEWPSQVSDLLAQIEAAGVTGEAIRVRLAAAARTNGAEKPLCLVVGAPTRVGAGETRQRFAVWRIDDEIAEILRTGADAAAGGQVDAWAAAGMTVESAWSQSPVRWCRVDDVRPEIVTRRDAGSALGWFTGKHVAVWGCGAIGAHVAEMLVRAGVARISLRDSEVVTSGLLVRQPFSQKDIGYSKVGALRNRLIAINPDLAIDLDTADLRAASEAAPPDWDADLIVDATASWAVATKTEAMRRAAGTPPPIASLAFGRDAGRGLLTMAPPGYTGATADVLRKTQIRLRTNAANPDGTPARPGEGRGAGPHEYAAAAEDFWSTDPPPPFTPNPGCSEPTFRGSHAAVVALSGAMLLKLGQLLGDAGCGDAAAAEFVRPDGVLPHRATLSFRFPPDAATAVNGWDVRVSAAAAADLAASIARAERESGPEVETGGHLFGARDPAARVWWIDEASGPPPDSVASTADFTCGADGVDNLARAKQERTGGATRRIGGWHTHPDGALAPSATDEAAFGEARVSCAHAESLHLIADGDGNASVFLLNQEPGDESRAIARSDPLELRGAPAPRRAADIALALSGGGARAIAFHLGVMRALNDRDWLERVGSISAASGGAVIAALYAYRDDPFEEFDRRVVQVLRDGITPRIFREALRPRHRWKAALGLWSSARALAGEAARAAIGLVAAVGVIDRRRAAGWAAALSGPRRAHTRTDAFAAALTGIVGTGAMPDVARPDLGVVISATDLRTGTAFRFGSRESGSWRLGRLRSGPPLVAEAVAASAAYPTLLPALDREYDFERNGGTQRYRVALSDGGLYDNVAASALDPDRDPNVSIQTSPARILIASDAGPGASARAAPYHWPGRVASAVSTTHRHAHDLERGKLFEHVRTGRLDALAIAYLGISDDHIPDAPPDLVRRAAVVDYPTDFSPMSDEDLAMLTKRGEQVGAALASHYLRGFE